MKHHPVERPSRSAPRSYQSYAEGTFTRVVEQRTAQIPSAVFLVASIAAMCASLAFELFDRERLSRFVGMWAPTLLVAGVYNKLVKTLGAG